MAPFVIGRLYKLEDFRVEWAVYFRRFATRYGLPTEVVVRGRGQFVVPNEARAFITDYQLYLNRFPMTQDQIRERAERQGRDFMEAMTPWPKWVYMVEVWSDHGDDGHTECQMHGYRFVSESALDDVDPRTETPRCMQLMKEDWED